jgi:hypothetical protein
MFSCVVGCGDFVFVCCDECVRFRSFCIACTEVLNLCADRNCMFSTAAH